MRRRDGEIEFDPRQFRNRARFLAAALAVISLAIVGRCGAGVDIVAPMGKGLSHRR